MMKSQIPLRVNFLCGDWSMAIVMRAMYEYGGLINCDDDFCFGFFGEEGFFSLGLEASYLSESIDVGGMSGVSSSTDT